MLRETRRWFIKTLRLVGSSRHSALPIVRERLQSTLRSATKRAIALLIGSMLIGAAVGFMVQADLGLAPYDVLSSAIGLRLDISLGQAGWIVAGVLFALSSLLGHRPSMWGIAYILANGFAIDATGWILNAPTTTAPRVLFVLVGIVTMAAGVNVVLYSGTTGGPFELLMAAGEERGVSRTAIRYLLDVAVLGLGIALGGDFGAATMIYALLMGVVLQALHQAFEDYGRGRELRRAALEPGKL